MAKMVKAAFYDDITGYVWQIEHMNALRLYKVYKPDFTVIQVQVMIMISLVGPDHGISMIFLWRKTGVSGENPPVRPDNKLSHLSMLEDWTQIHWWYARALNCAFI